MKNTENEVSELTEAIIKAYSELEGMSGEMSELMSCDNYVPKFNLEKFLGNYSKGSNEEVLNELIRELDIEYLDESWSEADWAAVYIAGGVGIILDILVTQTNLLKPIDKNIQEYLRSNTINDIQVKLDKFSSSFRNGESASIDFQDFKMHGLNSIHEQYSFGHDPLRFVEGILQFSTGNFRGIDKWGDVVSTEFGRGIPNIIHASISYVAHMVSDFLNIHSLPYPGSTLLMEFGSDKVREDIAAAYRGKYFNSRIPIYQGLPSFFASIIIHGWAVYDHYARTQKISFSVQDSLKYQPMLLVSNAMISASNLTINSVRCLLGQPHTLFRVNWPVLVNTVRHSIVFLRNSHNRILQNGKKIDGMYEELVKKTIKGKSVNQYLENFESEYKVYLKENKQKEG